MLKEKSNRIKFTSIIFKNDHFNFNFKSHNVTSGENIPIFNCAFIYLKSIFILE